ncbi:DUF3089 domain-containing protein [Tenacibaculum sp. M341]|uniref:DUF3089 domain-containing protein n=1 Tax=Tenacibaculum sp. M341 TaxID=2530339 RepID=UPI001052299B|nr:DUF3089 domain-containing protein [Tenacibaculum sp. M341]TCI85049.1 DUF3089 domain-containing protein [Tenacibaculum sp. M341]
MLKKQINIIYLLLIMVAFASCKTTYQTKEFLVKDAPATPDYNVENSWAVLPTKYTEGFKKYASNKLDTLQVDVFYLYPTLNSDTKDTRWNVPITDKEQNEKVINKAALMQASAFATTGKVYIPFYRQAHLRSYSMYKTGGKQAQELAYSDVKRAFETYLKKYNNNRPIIMVGHSQGTTHTLRLLQDFFDDKPLQKQLVAAYIPGIRVKENQFKTIPLMTTPNETGGFISWNTYKKGNYPKKDKDWYKGSVTTNPITWNLDKNTTLQQHKGFLYSNEKIYDKALKIEITDGLVWSSNPKFPLRFFMSFLKNYHAGDINLFWQDIRENALLRTNTYLKNNN